MDARTSFRPSQTHSGVSPQKTCSIPTLECGKLTVRYFPRVTAPLTLKSASPESVWRSPTGHSSSGWSRASLRPRSLVVSFLRLLT